MGRLVTAINERLLGSPEFDAVKTATASFRELLDSAARRQVNEALAEASALVMDNDEPLLQALGRLREPPVQSSASKTPSSEMVQS